MSGEAEDQSDAPKEALGSDGGELRGGGDWEARFCVDPATGHGTFEPLPSEADIIGLLNDPKGPHAVPPKEVDDAFRRERSAEVAANVANFVQDLGRLSKPFSVHHDGCELGSMVAGFQTLGCAATGTDLRRRWVEAGSRYCDGALTWRTLPEALSARSEKVDLFLSLHWLERLPDPAATLNAMRRGLSENGLIYLCVANGESLQVRLGGPSRHHAYRFPHVLHLFTGRSLVDLIRGAGLECFHMDCRWLPDTLNGPDYVFEQLLGLRRSDLPNPEALETAFAANLLGAQLSVLIGHPGNGAAVRSGDIDRRVNLAHAAFTAAGESRDEP